MDRYLCCVTLCLLSLGLMQSKAFEVRVIDDSNKTCIYANMRVNFTIHYETSQSTWDTVTLVAHDNMTTEGSTCGENGQAPLLKVSFGNYTWSLNFTRNDTVYSGDLLVFTYNTDDTALFPNAQSKGNLTAATSFSDPIPVNATYQCLHEETVVVGNVTQVYWNVTLQAYAQNATLREVVSCNADNPTTQAPTTRQVTTPNATTTATPTTKPVDKPATGNYSVSNATGTCLLASMGLQLNASLPVGGKNIWTLIDINPNTTVSSGSCGNESASLILNDNNRTVAELSFFLKNKNFHLQGINVTLMNGTAFFHQENNNLSLWEASLGNSYLCHKEQLITISENLSLNTFDVRVQPFNVKNDTYATASECSFDDDSILIPIVVGAALAGLIVIVVIAYLIGRRKSYAGYQTL